MSEERSNDSEPDTSNREDSSLNDSSRGVSDNDDGKQEILSEKEYKAVRYTKFLVYSMLFACAAASATATWFFVRSEEKREFEDEVS